ncbi:DTW domain-containing protein [Gallaecimonas kandeliae]|uniref:tRNA-uridine aminocarboxypropyltransferase n=1 Tax=Gallaecimonas kandeliae TaxID=3029055 RepID=UPI00264A0E8C|nr:tRNA-uridine aminocarboxypropyltransferase [Gallaecimonas kandeliae]WKE63966.1 DTW domain-containing protein [Gallaecimonas kandeliae]
MGRASCPDCERLRIHCICALVGPVPAKTRVLLVQYPGEERHPLGTAALVKKALPHSQLLRTQAVEALPLEWRDAALLFPGPQSSCLSQVPAPPRQLVVLDGTWRKALRLYEQSPALKVLPQVSLPMGEGSRYLLRKSRKDGALSTVEAVCQALALLEPGLDLSPLEQAFDDLIQRALVRMPAEAKRHYQ